MCIPSLLSFHSSVRASAIGGVEQEGTGTREEEKGFQNSRFLFLLVVRAASAFFFDEDADDIVFFPRSSVLGGRLWRMTRRWEVYQAMMRSTYLLQSAPVR